MTKLAGGTVSIRLLYSTTRALTFRNLAVILATDLHFKAHQNVSGGKILETPQNVQFNSYYYYYYSELRRINL